MAALTRALLSDAEWAFFEPFVTGIRTGHGGRQPRDHRRVLDGIYWIAHTGLPWRDLPERFGPWGTVHQQFRRWTLAGLWGTIHAALDNGAEGPGAVRTIVSTIVESGTRGSLKGRVVPPARFAVGEPDAAHP